MLRMTIKITHEIHCVRAFFLVLKYRFSRFNKKLVKAEVPTEIVGLFYKTVKNIIFLPKRSSTTIDSSKERSFLTLIGKLFL